MKKILPQNLRVLAGLIYLAILFCIFKIIGGQLGFSITDNNADPSIWFYAGAFMIIMGAYIVEPYFTKPTDAIANAATVLMALHGLSEKSELFGYHFMAAFSLWILVIAVASVFLKDFKNENFRKISKITYWFANSFGSAKVLYSIVYLSAAYSYFGREGKLAVFISLLAYWICLTFFDVVSICINKIAKLFVYLKSEAYEELGQAIGCENPLLYRVEIDYLRHKAQDITEGNIVAIEMNFNAGTLGMVIGQKHLLNKRWLSIYLLKNQEGDLLKVDLKNMQFIEEKKTLFSESCLAYLINVNQMSPDVKAAIESNVLYKNKDNFVGYVTKDSNINAIHFTIFTSSDNPGRQISEGMILKTAIYDQETLYQVINGNTKEERLENFDSYGYTVGIARKLGKYDYEKKELNTSKWLPAIYSPLFFAFSDEVKEERIKEISQNAIGRLPETDLEIPIKDINSIVTHNTAILGILGIGKSCLAFELIKKIANSGVKIICVDITTQYYSETGLLEYLDRELIEYDLPDAQKASLKTSKENKTKAIEGNPQASGNASEYVGALDQDLKQFLESTKKIKIYNPDLHPVSKGVAYKNTSLEDLTIAEKTRIISERLFIYAMNKGASSTAKYLLVFEEAHSLVPEWNSVANEGDKSATNGTAKVILQGRKYGLGTLVITQRTANVSKSILNQCNTIFAMRVFDDTGKGFLENYIGADYANTLPTLEERHAIAIGKGLKLKQPVILQLNDKKLIIKEVAI